MATQKYFGRMPESSLVDHPDLVEKKVNAPTPTASPMNSEKEESLHETQVSLQMTSIKSQSESKLESKEVDEELSKEEGDEESLSSSSSPRDHKEIN